MNLLFHKIKHFALLKVTMKSNKQSTYVKRITTNTIQGKSFPLKIIQRDNCYFTNTNECGEVYDKSNKNNKSNDSVYEKNKNTGSIFNYSNEPITDFYCEYLHNATNIFCVDGILFIGSESSISKCGLFSDENEKIYDQLYYLYYDNQKLGTTFDNQKLGTTFDNQKDKSFDNKEVKYCAYLLYDGYFNKIGILEEENGDKYLLLLKNGMYIKDDIKIPITKLYNDILSKIPKAIYHNYEDIKIIDDGSSQYSIIINENEFKIPSFNAFTDLVVFQNYINNDNTFYYSHEKKESFERSGIIKDVNNINFIYEYNNHYFVSTSIGLFAYNFSYNKRKNNEDMKKYFELNLK